VPDEYDPLVAKVVAWGPDRSVAIARMRRALAETVISGVPTTLPFHTHVLAEPDFVAGRYDTAYVASHWPPRAAALDEGQAVAAAVAAVLAARARAARSVPTAGARSPWADAARAEALRESAWGDGRPAAAPEGWRGRPNR